MSADPLLKRLQSATEGSRELDAAIHHEMGWRAISGYDGVWERGDEISIPPHYTTNLQDAVSLVPDGYMATITIRADRQSGHARVANVGMGFTEIAATPALALCIALIKAHESKATAPKLTEAQKRVVDDLV